MLRRARGRHFARRHHPDRRDSDAPLPDGDQVQFPDWPGRWTDRINATTAEQSVLPALPAWAQPTRILPTLSAPAGPPATPVAPRYVHPEP